MKPEIVVEMTEQEHLITSLGTIIELYRQHPKLTVPYLGDINAFVDDKDELFKIAKELGVKVHLGSSWAEVRFRISDVNALVFNVARDRVCERRQIGTRKVTRDKVETKVLGQETIEEPIYKWVCPPDLGLEGEEL